MRVLDYAVIYADPPWQYQDRVEAGRRGAAFKYPTMSFEEIEHPPVPSLAADDAALYLWTTGPMLTAAPKVIEAWGFTYRTVAFVWEKLNPKSGTTFMGAGSYTRANAEFCLLGTRGRLTRRDCGVAQIVRMPREEHSKKPDSVRHRIERLYGPARRIELFARQRVQGWDAWGNEVVSDVELREGRFCLVQGQTASISH